MEKIANIGEFMMGEDTTSNRNVEPGRGEEAGEKDYLEDQRFLWRVRQLWGRKIE